MRKPTFVAAAFPATLAAILGSAAKASAQA